MCSVPICYPNLWWLLMEPTTVGSLWLENDLHENELEFESHMGRSKKNVRVTSDGIQAEIREIWTCVAPAAPPLFHAAVKPCLQGESPWNWSCNSVNLRKSTVTWMSRQYVITVICPAQLVFKNRFPKGSNGTNNCWFPLARKWPTSKWTWIWIPYGKIEKKCPRYFRRDSRENPRDLNMCRIGRSAALSRGRKPMHPRRESMKLVVQQRKFT